MISIKKNTKIYIICPANLSTGGPEELHQLAAQLISQEIKTVMLYEQYDSSKNASPIHDNYKKYNIPFCFQVENASENIVVFPETFTYKLWEKQYTKTQKIIWWLSVIFYLKTVENTKERFEKKKFYFIKKIFKKYPIPTIQRLKNTKVFHIAHSYFSLDFLQKNNLQVIGQISGYMDDIFHPYSDDLKKTKENLIIYNALKNGAFLNQIIQKTPELHWVGLQNMTLQEVADWMKKAKIYIDFGFHPGREKMPRQACLLDCCLIIGKKGSAKFKQDMPILDQYHFEDLEENIPKIITKIKDCLHHYEQKVEDFAPYKKTISEEKNLFQKSVNSVFKLN